MKKVLAVRALTVTDFPRIHSEQSVEVTDVIKRRHHPPKKFTKKKRQHKYRFGQESNTNRESQKILQKVHESDFNKAGASKVDGAARLGVTSVKSKAFENQAEKEAREAQEGTDRAFRILDGLLVEICAEESDNLNGDASFCAASKGSTVANSHVAVVDVPPKRFAIGLGFNVKRFLPRGLANDDAASRKDVEDVNTKDIKKTKTNSEESVENDIREPEEPSTRTSQVFDDVIETDGVREAEHVSLVESVCLSADSITVEELEPERPLSPSRLTVGSRFKLTMTRALGKLAKKNADIERLEEEDLRCDPEQIHRWLEINRYKSKFLSDVWARATLNRRLKQNECTRRNAITEQNESIDDDGYCIEAPQGKRSMSTDEDDDDWELGTISQDLTERSCSRYEASFYEELMTVLAFEYERATGTCAVDSKPKCTSPEDVSVETGDASSMDSYSTTDNTATSLDDSSHLSPQTLLQFVERKIEDEILNSNICLNIDVCDNLQKTVNGDCCGNTDKSVRQLTRHQNEFLF